MEDEPRHEQHEQTPKQPQPRIYAASLSDYNNGRLHGAWIRADQEPEQIAADIAAMLEHSPAPAAEEWAIHDYEGFGTMYLSEYEDIDTIARLGQGIAEHGIAFAHWAAYVGTSDQDQLDRFDDHYLGHWPSIEDYAQDLLDDLGIHTEELGPAIIRPYIQFNIEAFARDLSNDMHTAEVYDGVIMFSLD